ncbi:hypothetical protein RE6C_01502 [Rhodopirellula europaea 6C]|uniref:Uncharacterized protein n=1 Tax=Rhodopirellula europaea 6C TaxID=1263867 RepID=M2A828_9BACT|nr:hypothetical protein RE6C_01502 [Rhodopirellula europaea 6C]
MVASDGFKTAFTGDLWKLFGRTKLGRSTFEAWNPTGIWHRIVDHCQQHLTHIPLTNPTH